MNIKMYNPLDEEREKKRNILISKLLTEVLNCSSDYMDFEITKDMIKYITENNIDIETLITKIILGAMNSNPEDWSIEIMDKIINTEHPLELLISLYIQSGEKRFGDF